MPVGEGLANYRDAIRRIALAHGAFNVRVFGSFARGEEGPGSDLDLLVDMSPERSLLDTINLIDELQHLLGRKVDVLTVRALNHRLKDRILNEAIPL
ncbi:MAG TPA: nucleotidyltransferase family protein [Fimbriimonas sp.]|nr:nucleotidyltransferase family protein [Fimbriimonas sp.]